MSASAAEPRSLDDMTRFTSLVARQAQARLHPTVPNCCFHIVVNQAGVLTIVVQGGEARVMRGALGIPDCRIDIDSVLSADALLERRLSPIRALLTGRVKASGNTGLAQQHLGELLGA